MGLNVNGTKLLLKLNQEGIVFGKVLSLGRQRLNLSKRLLQKNFNAFNIKASASEIKRKNKGYCEPFMELLGAERIDSMDVSSYESATLIHDLNFPIPDEFKGRYQTVIDSGTLEHIFNFPTAIKNCMELLQQGGHFIGLTPCNNFFGHGFYQFSPELYYRVFSEENGFKVQKMIFFLDDKNTSFYEVKDPAEVRQRVILNNAYPSYLFILAQKTAEKKIFETVPQQSDYENIIWKNEKVVHKLSKFVPKPLRKAPGPLKKFMEALSLLRNQIGTADKSFFKKLKI